jgi:type III secretion protein J
VSRPAPRHRPFGRGRGLAALLLALLLAACQVELFNSLSEREANDMLAILLRHGIDAQKVPVKEGLMSLTVEESRFAEAVELLRRYGYPRERFSSIGEIFKKEGLISSPLEERVRFVYALSQELSETISQIDGVLGARVHVVLPNNEMATESTVPSSAAVSIRHRADMALDRLIPQIKLLVVNSIEGLSYDKVSVVLFPIEEPVSAEEQLGLRQIGPLRLDPASVGGFWMIMGAVGGLAVLALAGCGVLGWLLLRRSNGSALQTADAG